MIEDILRAARINVPVYTLEQRMEDERRLAERIKKATGSLGAAERRSAKRWLAPSSPELSVLLQDLTDAAAETTAIVSLKQRLMTDLQALCRRVLKGDGAADRLVEFAEAVRRTDAAGALAFGCLIYLAGNEDGARFWWRFAAGAEDSTAAYCLFLEGLLREEPTEAVHCYRALNAAAFVRGTPGEQLRHAHEASPPARLQAEVNEHIREVNVSAGIDGRVPIPEKYLEEVPAEHRAELVAR
ncbi:hypothetical protein [Streptomyces javensis]|uniref:Uncharacterized protein n=1 Tax=Streptomyces javensis TaxID=114698 RepID=A0ABS0R3Q8_9ACTN|nr:hypothetical protein [Streptomyces javensis]MBI0312014.1 hypothetical protein [Streptomyces javensis]